MPSRPGVVVAPKAKSTAPVAIRSVSWDRIQQTLKELDAQAAASDVPVDEWPPERRAEVDARLYRGLQITADPATVDLLGVAEFRTTEFTRPRDADLTELARKLGATQVVWSGQYLGKTETIVQQPVTTYSTWTQWVNRKGRAGGARTVTESSTTWVPMRVEADESAFIAFFIARK